MARRQLALELQCASVRISIVDARPIELLYVTLNGINASFTEGPNDDERSTAEAEGAPPVPVRFEQHLKIELLSLQVDNQRYNTAYPVTLWQNASAADATPTLLFQMTRDISFRRPFVYVKSVALQMAPLSLRLDEESVRDFITFIDLLQPRPDSHARRGKDGHAADDAPQPSTLFEHSMSTPHHRGRDSDDARSTWGKTFIERLAVSRLALRVSVKRSPSAADQYSLNPLLALFNFLTTALINIDDAPVNFNPLLIERVFCLPDELGAAALKHYTSAIWRAAIAVAVSLDVIGKPYESMTDTFHALHAFLVAPALALVREPAAFVPKLLLGLSEVLKVMVRVPFNAMSKILQSWAKGVSLLTLDPAFAQRRQQTMEFRPAAHLLEGLSQGLSQLIAALWSATIYGFLEQVSTGYDRSGIAGVLTGFGRACVGLCFKPAVGLLDLAAKVFEGVKNTISAFQEKQRVRPPLVFHINRVLRPYAVHEARAQSMLINCEFDATHANLEQEFYVAHFSISWTTRQGYAGPPKLLLVTSQRVVLGDEARLRPEWEVRVERIARVELKPDHLMLWTWEKVRTQPASPAARQRATPPPRPRSLAPGCPPTRTTSSLSVSSTATIPPSSRRSSSGCGTSPPSATAPTSTRSAARCAPTAAPSSGCCAWYASALACVRILTSRVFARRRAASAAALRRRLRASEAPPAPSADDIIGARASTVRAACHTAAALRRL